MDPEALSASSGRASKLKAKLNSRSSPNRARGVPFSETFLSDHHKERIEETFKNKFSFQEKERMDGSSILVLEERDPQPAGQSSLEVF